jgi:hypothetical protein
MRFPDPAAAKLPADPTHGHLKEGPQQRAHICMQQCPNCGAGELKIIAAIHELPVIQKILEHLELDPQSPPRARARDPGPHFAA